MRVPITLGSRFLKLHLNFNSRIIVDVALIITLFVVISGIITGISVQFSSFLYSVTNSTDSNYYVAVQKDKVLETSQVPSNFINSIDRSYITFLTPIISYTAVINNPIFFHLNYYLLNLTEFRINNPEFYLAAGSYPVNTSEVLIGLGLAEQLGIVNNLPYTITITIENSTYHKIITGIVNDSGPWYFGIISSIIPVWNSTSYISGFEFRIKNSQFLNNFEMQIQELKTSLHLTTELDYQALKQTNGFCLSLYNELHLLFIYFSMLLLALMSAKLIHSSFMLYKKMKRELTLCRILGMQLPIIHAMFFFILFVSGNIGVIFGIFLGLLTPLLLVYSGKLLLNATILPVTPSITDLLFLVLISNLIFAFCSFYIYNLHFDSMEVEKHL